jgi:protein-S-isoprenylcysteine O-methyltransferase Ste14
MGQALMPFFLMSSRPWSIGTSMRAQSNHAEVMLAPPLVYAGYLVGALVLNWGVPFPLRSFPVASSIGMSLVVAGFALGAFAMSRMLQAHTSPDPHRPTTTLITDGPYRLSRNPIYLGFMAIYLGFTVFAGTLWGVLLSPFLIWTITRAVIRPEEAYLRIRFDSVYLQYQSRVRRWL